MTGIERHAFAVTATDQDTKAVGCNQQFRLTRPIWSDLISAFRRHVSFHARNRIACT